VSPTSTLDGDVLFVSETSASRLTVVDALALSFALSVSVVSVMTVAVLTIGDGVVYVGGTA
jgi:hypothetical protein